MLSEKNYKKNYFLIGAFLALASISLIIVLILGYNFAKKNVENDFLSLKIDVLDKTLEPYNTFYQNKIPQAAFYQGYLDSLSAAKYANTLFYEYPFISQILFYDAQITNHNISYGFKYEKLAIGIKGLYKFKKNGNQRSTIIFKNDSEGNFTLDKNDDFNKISLKFCYLLEKTDSIKSVSPDAIYKTFFNVTYNKITYMCLPKPSDLLTYKTLMLQNIAQTPIYEQDFLSFDLDPYKIKIQNQHPELYQFISLRKTSYDPVYEQPNLVSTNVIMPGAFADYKLHFASERNYLNKEINNRFTPIASGTFFVYLILSFITYLLFRNLNINQKLFKLQYDFINNFTHEFKTPVSVIKIAGNNIKSASGLSLAEKNHYGKILDEEADKLNDLMNKLLSFTQLETKSILLKSEKINIEIFTQNIIDSCLFKYPDYEIDLHIVGQTTFFTDPILLASIFNNLINNAYKYSAMGNKKLKINIKTVKNNMHFSFADKGIGIPATEYNNIFKKFYRIQSQYNQQGSVGLGLAFCKEVVNYMNGTITVHSKLKIGSTFVLILPNNQ